MNDKFFIPFNETFIKAKDIRSLNSKSQHLYKDNYFVITRGQNIKWWNKPYFAITNESSTVRFFLDAVFKNFDYDEASVYMSKDSRFELDDVKEIFGGMRNYKYAKKLADEKRPDFATVTIIPNYDGSSSNSLIHMKMVYEPNRYSKWKIYKIEETVC